MTHGHITLKKYALNSLVNFLSIPLAGREARSRNRFLLLLADPAKKFEADRMELLKQHGDLDEKGELVIGEDAQYKLKDMAAFQEDFKKYRDETFNISCEMESLIDFQAVHKILENLQSPLDVEQTRDYEQIMTAFETWAASQAKAE